MFIENLYRCSYKMRCMAVFPKVYAHHAPYPDELGDEWFITTPELLASGKCIGSGRTEDEAWEDACDINSAEIADRIRSGHYIREIPERWDGLS